MNSYFKNEKRQKFVFLTFSLIGIFVCCLLGRILFANVLVAKEGTDNVSPQKNKRILVDKIVARVNGRNILQSDLEEKKIAKDNHPYSLEELITEELLIQKAFQRGVVLAPVEIEKQIAAIKQSYGIGGVSDEEFDKILNKELGLSLQSYKEQLTRLLTVQRIKQLELNERIVVTSQEVEEYHKKNPGIIPERCYIKIADVPENLVENWDASRYKDKVSWVDLEDGITRKDISKELDFIFAMKENEISKPIKRGNKYEVVWLVRKTAERKKTLEERYDEIEGLLREQKRRKLEKEYESELRREAFITYL